MAASLLASDELCESIRARVLRMSADLNIKPEQLRIVVPRVFIENIAVEFGDVRNVLIETRKTANDGRE